MNLSAHFTADELTISETAARLGIDNEPSAAVVANLKALCADILEPLRNALGRPIFVTSGYRSAVLNSAVNGSRDSDHVLGLAADIVVPPMDIEAVADVVRTLAPFVPLKQCICEFGKWVHVSRHPLDAPLSVAAPEFLIASLNDRGSTVYSKWES